MKRSFVVLLVAAAMLALAAGPVMAGAFRIPEAGAKAMAFGNAFVGMADDPSAVQFNPAGMTQLEGNQILTGVTSVTTSNSYASTSGVKSDAEKGSFLPPHFFYTNHLEDLGDGNWWLGLGVVAPFGLGTEWKVSTFGYYATKTELELVKINPAMAYKLNDQLSLAFGLDYYKALSLIYANNADVPYGTTGARVVTEQELSGDGDGYGYNFAAHYKGSDQLKVGFAYRSGTDLDAEGDITFGGTKAGSGSATLKLPATAALGFNYAPAPKWDINLDLDWTGWSSYDELVIDAVIMGSPEQIVFPKDYDDTIAYRVGGQYQYSDKWAFRAGILMEETPLPEETYDPRLPDGDRTGYSIGAGYEDGPWSVDFAYMLVNIDKYDVATGVAWDPDVVGDYSAMPWLPSPPGPPQPPVQTVDGEYEGDITLIALSVGYTF